MVPEGNVIILWKLQRRYKTLARISPYLIRPKALNKQQFEELVPACVGRASSPSPEILNPICQHDWTKDFMLTLGWGAGVLVGRLGMG